MKQLSIAFVNVRSLVPHFADFSYFLESQDLDIVGVSETWLNSDVPTNLLNVKNYTFLRKDRVGRGGGVGMYISNNLEFSVVLSESSFTLEELWVEVKLESFQQPCLIGGDFNGHHHVWGSPKNDSVGQQLVEAVGECNMVILNNGEATQILEGLEAEGVTEVKRIYKKKENQSIETASLILTFNKPHAPQKIKAAFYQLEVRPLFRAQCSASNASVMVTFPLHVQTQICVSVDEHLMRNHVQILKFGNCGLEHSARYRNCSKYKEEENIQRTKSLELI
nr:unnamed protein product [Callosobruchus chinensis]